MMMMIFIDNSGGGEDDDDDDGRLVGRRPGDVASCFASAQKVLFSHIIYYHSLAIIHKSSAVDFLLYVGCVFFKFLDTFMQNLFSVQLKYEIDSHFVAKFERIYGSFVTNYAFLA